jgi:hypothetical protein
MNSKPPSTPILALLSATAFFPTTDVVALEGYRLDGTEIYEVLRPDGTVGALREYTFSISVDGQRWRLDRVPVRFVRDGKVREVLPESYIASSDGTNVYYLTSMLTNLTFSAPSVTSNRSGLVFLSAANVGATNLDRRQTRNTASAIIGKGVIPYDMPDSSIHIMWYAFASEAYFSTVRDDYIYPVHGFTSVGEASRDFRARASWELTRTSPRLPRWILFGSYERFMDSEGKATRQDILRATNCFYQVRAFTNWGGWTFPLEVFAQFYVHPVATNYSIVRPSGTVSATVTGIVAGAASAEFTPVLPGQTLISDIRPVDRNAAAAAAMGIGTRWPTVAEAGAQYAHQAKAWENTGRRAERRLVSFRAAFAAICVLPLGLTLLWWALGRRKRRKTNTKRNVNEYE